MSKKSKAKTLNIGLDLDITMYAQDFIAEAWKYFGGEKPDISSMKSWSVDDWDVPFKYKPVIKEIFKDPDFMCSLRLNDGVLPITNKWKRQGHKLFVITAREDNLTLPTIKMLNKDFGVGFFEDIIISKNKNKFFAHGIQGSKLDVWVDDNFSNASAASSFGIKTFLINNEHTPYNIGLEDINKRIKNVRDFSEIDL